VVQPTALKIEKREIEKVKIQEHRVKYGFTEKNQRLSAL
jgi:hypothetical protein